MNSYSFVLNAEYIYYDKSNKKVSYVYIPSMRECSDYDALKEMAAEVSRRISVGDADLENKVLRAIMKDFDPQEFMRMLGSYIEAAPPAMAVQPVMVGERREPGYPIYQADQSPSVVRDACIAPLQTEHTLADPSGPKTQDKAHSAFGDIVISFPEVGKPAKKTKNAAKATKNSSGKKEKEQGGGGIVTGLFGKKKDAQKESNKKVASAPPLSTEYGGNGALSFPGTQAYVPPAEESDVTQCISAMANSTRLRLVGSPLLPQEIEVRIAEGEIFTIGRFDTAVGKQQSNFEFGKKTKAVSRRHAAIERHLDGYSIIDLSSSAGTLINGQKLPPNTQCRLKSGCRVSFGNSGADYVWEE